MRSSYALIQVEIETLKTDNQRWRARSNQLIEKHQKINPEEMKRLQTDNSNLTKQISQLQLEVRRYQGNVASLTERAKTLQDNSAKAAQEGRAKQAELARLGQELKNAKTLSQGGNSIA